MLLQLITVTLSVCGMMGKFENEKSIWPTNNDSHQKREYFEKMCQGLGYSKDSGGMSACFQYMRSQNKE